MSSSALKDRATEAIRACRSTLVGLSEEIFGTPELAFQEHRAAAAVLRTCTSQGFSGAAGTGGLETAVLARSGTGALQISFVAEYDALPDIGHACGHNLIAAASVGAAIGLAAVADEVDATVTLVGSPAEERGGGKIELLRAGAFDSCHAALMAHPAPAPFDVSAPRTLSVEQFEIAYTGKAAHASVSPQSGVNAADAMTIAQVAIGLLRQQLAPGLQVHGVVTQAGVAANIIPDHAQGDFFLRAAGITELAELEERVLACFRAGATATGCGLDVLPVGQPYAELAVDAELSALYQLNAGRHGRHFTDLELPAMGSTDMGNVSQALPSIHPYFGLSCLPALPHHPDFALHVNTESAHSAMVEVACALADTAIDAATVPAVRERLLARPATS